MKIAIIGAGISGLYLAWKLSEKGDRVTVFEKRGKIGKEACSGLFSERILKFVPQSQGLIQHEIEKVLIHFPKKTLEIKFSNRFLVMNHCQLDGLAADLAKENGAEIIFNHPLSSFLEISRAEGVAGGYDRIIGCDGALSGVRKEMKLPSPNFRLGIYGFVSEKCSDRFVSTWPTKSGFIWKIPRGGETEYGIIEKPEKARTLFEEFLREKEIQLERINPLEEFRQPRPFFQKGGVISRSESKFLYGVNSAIIPQGFIVPNNPNVTLCGDAAGLTKPWSGGGVIWSLIAADILIKNFPNFSRYQKEAKKVFLPRIVFSKIATRTIHFLGFNLPWILPKNYTIEGDFLI